MKPYDKKFTYQKMKNYNELINESSCGNYKIIKKVFNDKKLQGYMYNNDKDYDVPVTQLIKEDASVMKITPKEIEGSYQAISFAYGKVGIVGLGLGYVVQEIAKKDNVDQVIVYEISKEVIDLYNKNFKSNDKIKIINCDAFKAESETFDFFYVDIYDYKLSLDVVEDYKKFNKLHKIEEYCFWGLEHFLLSCNYEEIIWVYIPEMWIAMSKKCYEALNSSGYIQQYKPLDEKLVKRVLSAFKEVLNEGM